MKLKSLFLTIFSIIGVSGICLGQSVSDLENFEFGENRKIVKRNLCFLKDGKQVNRDSWRVLDAEGVIGATKTTPNMLVIAYDEPDFTDYIQLTDENNYDSGRKIKFFGYKYGEIKGRASLFIDKGCYVFMFKADIADDGTEKWYLYYFK